MLIPKNDNNDKVNDTEYVHVNDNDNEDVHPTKKTPHLGLVILREKKIMENILFYFMKL